MGWEMGEGRSERSSTSGESPSRPSLPSSSCPSPDSATFPPRSAPAVSVDAQGELVLHHPSRAPPTAPLPVDSSDASISNRASSRRGARHLVAAGHRSPDQPPPPRREPPPPPTPTPSPPATPRAVAAPATASCPLLPQSGQLVPPAQREIPAAVATAPGTAAAASPRATGMRVSPAPGRPRSSPVPRRSPATTQAQPQPPGRDTRGEWGEAGAAVAAAAESDASRPGSRASAPPGVRDAGTGVTSAATGLPDETAITMEQQYAAKPASAGQSRTEEGARGGEAGMENVLSGEVGAGADTVTTQPSSSQPAGEGVDLVGAAAPADLTTEGGARPPSCATSSYGDDEAADAEVAAVALQAVARRRQQQAVRARSRLQQKASTGTATISVAAEASPPLPRLLLGRVPAPPLPVPSEAAPKGGNAPADDAYGSDFDLDFEDPLPVPTISPQEAAGQPGGAEAPPARGVLPAGDVDSASYAADFEESLLRSPPSPSGASGTSGGVGGGLGATSGRLRGATDGGGSSNDGDEGGGGGREVAVPPRPSSPLGQGSASSSGGWPGTPRALPSPATVASSASAQGRGARDSLRARTVGQQAAAHHQLERQWMVCVAQVGERAQPILCTPQCHARLHALVSLALWEVVRNDKFGAGVILARLITRASVLSRGHARTC